MSVSETKHPEDQLTASPKPEAEEQTKQPATPKAPTPPPSELKLRLSDQLHQRIKYQAEEEGISVNEYLVELISEGVVLRAWEILEKKAQMRGANSAQGNFNGNSHRNHGGGRRNDKFGNGNGGNGRRGMNNQRYNSIMDDKASFLEYVRNQERQHGR